MLKMLASMPSDEEINSNRHSSVIDKSDWITVSTMECLEKSDVEVIRLLSKVDSLIHS